MPGRGNSKGNGSEVGMCVKPQKETGRSRVILGKILGYVLQGQALLFYSKGNGESAKKFGEGNYVI